MSDLSSGTVHRLAGRPCGRADRRRTVRRLLNKYGYPPDLQVAATQLVIRQAEPMADNLVSA